MSTEKTVKSERIPTLWTASHKSDVYSLQGRPLAAVLHDLSEAIVMHVDNPWQVSEGGPADPLDCHPRVWVVEVLVDLLVVEGVLVEPPVVEVVLVGLLVVDGERRGGHGAHQRRCMSREGTIRMRVAPDNSSNWSQRG